MNWDTYKHNASLFSLPGRWLLPALVPVAHLILYMLGFPFIGSVVLVSMAVVYFCYAELEFSRLKKKEK